MLSTGPGGDWADAMEACLLQAACRLAEEGARWDAALVRRPVLTGYLLTGGFSGAALFAYITAAPRLIIGQLHISSAHFGWVFGANAIGLVLGGQVNARLARRIPGDILLQGALAVALAASLALLAYRLLGAPMRSRAVR